MRLKTRIVTILLVCCFLLTISIIYFIIFSEDLQSLPQNTPNKKLIILPFTQVKNSSNKNNQTQKLLTIVEKIESKVVAKLKSVEFAKLLSRIKDKNQQLTLIIESLENDLKINDSLVGKVMPWKKAASWVRAREILPKNGAEHLGFVLNSMRNSLIKSADVAKRGTQLKLMLELEGGQKVLFKPQRYHRDEIITGSPFAGADRHNGEIAAFHLSRLLDMRYTPLVTSRRIHVANEIKKVATSALSATFVVDKKNNKTSDNCFFGECFYCSEFDSVCSGEDGFLEGAVVLMLPIQYQLQKLRSPWQRTYKKGITASWENDEEYCQTVIKKLPLRPRILDLIDISIFDFLIGNADRHHYEVFKDVSNSLVLLLDNGKSFGNHLSDELTILAPLYQCCYVRNTTWQRLLLFTSSPDDVQLSSALIRLIIHEPVEQLINEHHLKALDRRLKIVLAVIAICFENKSYKEVLK